MRKTRSKISVGFALSKASAERMKKTFQKESPSSEYDIYKSRGGAYNVRRILK